LFVLLGAWLRVPLIDDPEIRAALAETDRLDPGWRFADLEKARPAVADGENSAIVTIAARRLLSRAWLPPPPPRKGTGLEQALLQASLTSRPASSPRAHQTEDRRPPLEPAGPALPQARKLSDMPRGRHLVAWAPDFVSTMLPHLQDCMEVARLLSLDAMMR